MRMNDVSLIHRYMTGWRLWTGTGDLVTWRSGNSRTLEPPGGQHTFWNMPEDH